MAAPLHTVCKTIKHTVRHQRVQFKVTTFEFMQITQSVFICLQIPKQTYAVDYKFSLY